MKQNNRKQFKSNHDAIINALTTKQYFNWHRSWNGDLDYKAQAESIKKSTINKKAHALCDTQIRFYNSVIGG